MIEPPFLRRQRQRNIKKIEPVPIVMNALLSKLLEPSTIRGLISVAGAFGLAIHPEMVTHIVAAVMAINGIINVWRKEPPKAEVVK